LPLAGSAAATGRDQVGYSLMAPGAAPGRFGQAPFLGDRLGLGGLGLGGLGLGGLGLGGLGRGRGERARGRRRRGQNWRGTR
jgi:hypothetical protein